MHGRRRARCGVRLRGDPARVCGRLQRLPRPGLRRSTTCLARATNESSSGVAATTSTLGTVDERGSVTRSCQECDRYVHLPIAVFSILYTFLTTSETKRIPEGSLLMNSNSVRLVAIGAALLATAAGVAFATHGAARPAAASVPGCTHTALPAAANRRTCSTGALTGRERRERHELHDPVPAAPHRGPAGPGRPACTDRPACTGRRVQPGPPGPSARRGRPGQPGQRARPQPQA